jgi:spoIIIJ-associated protein
VEWIETTGTTVDEAKDAALDQLGVDADEAEFEVLEEPRSGLFGRTRGVGRVRARVVPRGPRPKQERRRKPKAERSDAAPAGAEPSTDAPAEVVPAGPADGSTPRSGGSGQRRNGRSRTERSDRAPMDPDRQCEVVQSFLEELVASFGVQATVAASIEDDVLTGSITGDELGRLIGPRLQTLDAVQEIARNVLQRHAGEEEYAKVVVDAGGAREFRRDALTAFVRDAVEQVRSDGGTAVLEVMNSADRKVVHDTVAELDGVQSSSEGEDPRRRVVITTA